MKFPTTCLSVTVRNLVKLLFCFLLMGCWTGRAYASTTYYVSNAGSDTNAGTSESSPFQQAPGMTSCASNCAGVSLNPGDSVIFRGGDAWHNTGSPSGFSNNWDPFSASGTSGNNIYVGGGDETWFGSSCSQTGIVETNGTQVLLAAYGESTVGHPSAPFIATSAWNGAASQWIGGHDHH